MQPPTIDYTAKEGSTHGSGPYTVFANYNKLERHRFYKEKEEEANLMMVLTLGATSMLDFPMRIPYKLFGVHLTREICITRTMSGNKIIEKDRNP
jgi:hypothetical protein